MTKLGEMTLEEALEHHGVKGMHWGVRKQIEASRAASADIKTAKKLGRSSHKGVVAERKAHGEKIKEKKANDPLYAKAIKRQTSSGRAATKSLLKLYAQYKFIGFLISGSGSSRTTGRGRDFVASKPPMMNAPLRDGVFRVTTV